MDAWHLDARERYPLAKESGNLALPTGIMENRQVVPGDRTLSSVTRMEASKGCSVKLPPLIKQLDAYLEGIPDTILSVILIALGTFAIVVAFFGRPTLKAALAAWFIAP